MPTSYQKQINIDENGKESRRDDTCTALPAQRAWCSADEQSMLQPGAARAEAVLCGSDFFERFGPQPFNLVSWKKLVMSLYLRAWGVSYML